MTRSIGQAARAAYWEAVGGAMDALPAQCWPAFEALADHVQRRTPAWRLPDRPRLVLRAVLDEAEDRYSRAPVGASEAAYLADRIRWALAHGEVR